MFLVDAVCSTVRAVKAALPELSVYMKNYHTKVLRMEAVCICTHILTCLHAKTSLHAAEMRDKIVYYGTKERG